MNPISFAKHFYRFVSLHPLGRLDRLGAMRRFVRWQVASRIAPGTLVLPFVGGTRLAVARGMTGATGNYYVGLHEFDEMAFVIHCLRPSDLFCDVGANIGSYTVLASGVVGAKSICFEPAPSTFESLLLNIAINALHDRVDARREAVGSAVGAIQFTSTLDTVNHVVTQGESVTAPSISVPVTTLDAALAGYCPAVLKMDVEGYEKFALEGGTRTLRDARLKAILMETNGAGDRYGTSDGDCAAMVLEAGFKPFRYDAWKRQLVAVEGTTPSGNTIFARDLEFVRERLKSAPAFRALGVTV